MIATVINAAIALILCAFAIKYKNRAIYLIILLFVYISLHYAYSTAPIFFGMKYYYLRLKTQIPIKLIGAGFLLFIASLIILNNFKIILYTIKSQPNRQILILTIFWFASACIYLFIKIVHDSSPSFLEIQDIVSSLFMLGLAFIISSTVHLNSKDIYYDFKKILIILASLTILMNIFSIYQLVSIKSPVHAFPGYAFIDGKYYYIRRATGLLFNPNMFAMWCAFVAAFAAYIYHLSKKQIVLTAITILLATFGILSSGSRSGIVICTLMIGTSALLNIKPLRKNNIIFSFLPFIIFILSFVGLGTIFKVTNIIFKESFKIFYVLSNLTERFSTMPKDVYGYAIYKLNNYFAVVSSKLYHYTGNNTVRDLSVYCNDKLKGQNLSSIHVNIDGRLDPNIPLPDNGYFAMYHDSGYIGLIFWILLFVVLLTKCINNYRINPSVNSGYAISASCACMLTAIFMRAFQVFPIWVILSIGIGLSISSLRSDTYGKTSNAHS